MRETDDQVLAERIAQELRQHRPTAEGGCVCGWHAPAADAAGHPAGRYRGDWAEHAGQRAAAVVLSTHLRTVSTH